MEEEKNIEYQITEYNRRKKRFKDIFPSIYKIAQYDEINDFISEYADGKYDLFECIEKIILYLYNNRKLIEDRIVIYNFDIDIEPEDSDLNQYFITTKSDIT